MNRIMMIVVATSLCLCVAGCDQNGIDYTTTCDMKKVDGKAVTVTVTLPHPSQNQPATLVLNNREQVQKMIDALESLKVDLELARDQMPTTEPPSPEPVKE